MTATEDALVGQRKIIALSPDVATGFFDAAGILRDLGSRDLALVGYRRALAIEPRDVRSFCNQGIVFQELGRPASALECYEAALAVEAENIGALLNRAAVLLELRRPAEACGTCHRAIAVAPALFDALNELAVALEEHDAPQDAVICFDRALAVRPDAADAFYNRGVALQRMTQDEAALASYEKAIEIDANHLLALSNRAAVLHTLGRLEEALQSCDRVLKVDPRHVPSLLSRGQVLASLARHGQAVLNYGQVLALSPDHADGHRSRGNSLLFQGQVADALLSLRRALANRPDDADILSNIVYALDFSQEAGFVEHQSARRRWFDVYRRGLPASITDHQYDRDPARRLRLGYVSADFKHHSAAFIFGPVIQRHDRSAFEVVCYSNVAQPDGKTRDFEKLADRWHVIRNMSDDDVAALVRTDRIDILVDLSGHSAGQRLGVFGRKPAPIQVTAWGLGSGNGMPAIDYLFSDAVSIPAEVRNLFAETIVDLPTSMTFEAPAYAPPIGPLPALANGAVTFGCFNRLAKISEPVMRVWAEILAAVPGSRLVLKDPPLDDPHVRAAFGEAFAALGVERSRLDMRGRTPHAEHLALFGEIDIALDPFPQNGGISTWEALWMGCPTVAKLGKTIAGRASASILTSIGLGEWVAGDDAAYVALAVRWANDLRALSGRRSTLRRAIAESDSGDPDRYVRSAERAYRRMWEKWCADGR